VKIGVPKEVKTRENRVAMTPAGVAQLSAVGHPVLVETGAGLGSGFGDDEYRRSGARIVDAKEAWTNVDMVVKVKEPQSSELGYLRANLVVFTYFHLAPQFELAMTLCRTRVTAVAYETVQLPNGRLPLLAPMSEIAGRLSIQVGSHWLQTHRGGCGILLEGVPGSAQGKVTVIGGGIAGENAAVKAARLGADVWVFDVNLERLRYLESVMPLNAKALLSQPQVIAERLRTTNLLVGAVYLTGDAAPRVVTREMLAGMPKGAVAVDISIDQGGCFETSRPTTHDQPTYVEEGVIHYCVTNMPAAVARTATFALANATIPYVAAIAHYGLDGAIARLPELAGGVNVRRGEIVHPTVARALTVELAS
jgi:alanine dehydrogenase